MWKSSQIIFPFFLFLTLANCFTCSANTNDSLKLVLDSVTVELDPFEHVNILNKIAWNYRDSELDSSKKYGIRALAIAKKNNDYTGESSSHTVLFEYYLRKEIKDSSKYHVIKQIEIATQQNDSSELANGFNNLGIYYLSFSKYRLAAHYMYQSISIDIGSDSQSYYTTLNNIGSCFFYLKDYEKAIEIFRTVADFFFTRQEEVPRYYLNALLGLAESNVMANRYVDAQIALDKTYPVVRVNESELYLVITNTVQAQVFAATGACRKSKDLALLALASPAIESAPFLIPENYLTITKALMCEKRFSDAKDTLVHIKSKYEGELNTEHSMEWQNLFHLVESELGENKSALEAYKEFRILEDSIRNQEYLDQIHFLNTTMEVDKKNLTIDIQKEKINVKNKLIKFQYIVISSVSIAIVFLFIIGILEIKRRKERIKAEKKEAVLEGKWEATQTQRAKISQNLHDGVGYNLRIILENLKKQISPNDELKDAIKTLQSVKQQVRSIAYQLQPLELEDIPLVTALEIHSQRFEHSSGLKFHLDIFPPNLLDNLPYDLSNAIYRIVQECSSNTMDHAKATKVDLHISENTDGVNFIFEDNGVGFNFDINNMGSGLINIKKRCNELRGEFQLDSKIGHGTTIHIDFPYSFANA